MNLDQVKLEAFMGRMIGELGPAINVPLMMLGDRLGLFKAMTEAGPVTSKQLAVKTGTDERYLREWLCAMAAGGLVTFDPAADTFTLPDEHAFALAVAGLTLPWPLFPFPLSAVTGVYFGSRYFLRYCPV